MWTEIWKKIQKLDFQSKNSLKIKNSKYISLKKKELIHSMDPTGSVLRSRFYPTPDFTL